MNKTKVLAILTITFLMLFLVGCEITFGPKNNDPNPDEDKPVVVSAIFATDEILAEYNSYLTANLTAGADAVKIIFTTTAPTSSFRFFEVAYEEQADEFVFVERNLLYSTIELSPERPVVALIVFPGSIPTRGISYLDENGDTKQFVVSISGNDGSLILIEF